MFATKLRVEYLSAGGARKLCPIHWIDNFAMRNFTNDAIFDDTLPREDGLLEAGYRVPIGQLQEKMEAWFRRKGYLQPTESLEVTVAPSRPHIAKAP